MSRYSSEAYRWRRGSGSGSHSSDHSGHHWSSSSHSSHGYSHQPPLLPDPYLSFEQQPSWSPNELMQWLPQESWGWQQIPQAAGFGPPGGTGFLKPNPKTKLNQPKHQQLNHQSKQKTSSDQKQNKKQHQQPNFLQQQHNKQQLQLQQSSKKHPQQNNKKQQHQLQQKVGTEKKLELSSCLERNDDQPKASPPLGSEEARRKALASTADKLRRCLSSMGQERTEVLETLLDEPSSVVDKSGMVTQKDGLSKCLSPLQPVPPSEREIQLSAADWRHIGLSSQKATNKEEDDVVFVSAPPPEMVAIEDSSDEESHQEKAATPLACAEVKETMSSDTRKMEPTTTEDSEQDVDLDGIENCEFEKKDLTLKLTETDSNLGTKLSHEKISFCDTVSTEGESIVTTDTEELGNVLCASGLPECSETEALKGKHSENVSLAEKESLLPESVEANIVTDVGSAAASPVQSPKGSTPVQLLQDVASVHLQDAPPVSHLQDVAPIPSSQQTPESSLVLPPQSNVLQTSLESSAPVCNSTKESGGTVEALKRNVMQKLLVMGAAGVRDIVDNPSQSRRVQHALRLLVNEHRTAWTRHMRRIAEMRFRRDCNSTVQSVDLGAPPDLDADAAVDLASLPPELIERLGDLLQLDGMGATAECSDAGTNNSGLEELQELQEALSRQARVADVTNPELSDLIPETKKEIGDIKLELEEEMDTFDTSAVLDPERDADTITAESSSTAAAVTEFGSLFCDFPDFSNDLDHASTSSPTIAVNENLDTALHISGQTQEISSAENGDLTELAASTNTGSDVDLHTGNTSQSVEICQLTSNAITFLEEPLMEDLNSSSQSESLHSTEERLSQINTTELVIVPEPSASVANISGQPKHSSRGGKDDTITATTTITTTTTAATTTTTTATTTTTTTNNNNNNNNSNNDNSYKKISHIRTLAARKEYKINESPVDSETQTDLIDEPDLLLDVLQQKFSVPGSVLTALRKYIQSSRNLVHEAHSSPADSSSGGQCRIPPLPRSSHLSPTVHHDSALCTSVANSSMVSKKKANNASKAKKRKTFCRNLSNVSKSNSVNATTSATGDTCKYSPPHDTTSHYDCVPCPSNTRDYVSLDSAPNCTTTNENTSVIQTVVLSQFQEIYPENCEAGAALNKNSVGAFPLGETSHTGYITDASSHILEQMFDIDSQVSQLMKRKLELYKQLQGIFTSAPPRKILSKRAKKAIKLKRIRRRKEASRKLYREHQQMMKDKIRLDSSHSVTSCAVLEDNMNSMPVLENAAMEIRESQDVLASQTIPVLHREEAIVRKELNSIGICSDNSQVSVKETCRSLCEIPFTSKINDRQSLYEKGSIAQSCETVLRTNEVDSQIVLQSLSSGEKTSLSLIDSLTEGNKIFEKENFEVTGLNLDLNIQVSDTQTCSGSPERERLKNSTLDVLNQNTCESLPQRSDSPVAQSEMEYSCSDKVECAIKTSCKAVCSIGKELSSEPVVRLTDITKNIKNPGDKTTFDDVSKQTPAQPDNKNTSQEMEEKEILKNDELIEEVLGKKQSTLRTPTNKKRKGRASSFSKTSRSKKRKQTLGSTSRSFEDSSGNTQSEDVDNFPIVSLVAADLETNTVTQEYVSTDKQVENELGSTLNTQENVSANIRSMRRKRPYSESVNHESSEDCAADVSQSRNKRQRGKNVAVLSKSIDTDLDTSAPSSSKKAKRERSATGKSLRSLQPLQYRDEEEKHPHKKEKNYKTPNENEDIREEKRLRKAIRYSTQVVNQSHYSNPDTVNNDVRQRKEENIQLAAFLHKISSSTKRTNVKSKCGRKSGTVQSKVVKNDEAQTLQEGNVVEMTTSPELSSTVNSKCRGDSADMETQLQKTDCDQTSQETDIVEKSSSSELSSTKRTDEETKSRRKSIDLENKVANVVDEQISQKADLVEINSSSELLRTKRSNARSKVRRKLLDVETKVLKSDVEKTLQKADLLEINSTLELPLSKRPIAKSRASGKFLDEVTKVLKTDDEQTSQKAEVVQMNSSPESPPAKRSTAKSKTREKSLDVKNKDLSSDEQTLQKSDLLEKNSYPELPPTKRSLAKSKTREKPLAVENKALSFDEQTPQKADLVVKNSSPELLPTKRSTSKSKTREKPLDVENTALSSDEQTPQKADLVEKNSSPELTLTKRPTAKSKTREKSLDVENMVLSSDEQTTQKADVVDMNSSLELPLTKRSCAKSKARGKSLDLENVVLNSDKQAPQKADVVEMTCFPELPLTKRSPAKAKARGKSIDEITKVLKTDCEQRPQKSDTVEMITSPESLITKRSNPKSKARGKSIDMETKVQQIDVNLGEMPSNADLSSAKKANVKSKAGGKSIDVESKILKTEDDDDESLQRVDMREMTASPVLPSPKRTGIKTKARQRSVDEESKWHRTNSEQTLHKNERTSSPELVSESDTEPLLSFAKRVKKKFQPKKRGARIKAELDAEGDCSVSSNSVVELEDRSGPPEEMSPVQAASEPSLVTVTKKEKDEVPLVSRNHSITAKSWRMRAVAEMRQCEVKLHRLTDEEVRAATACTPGTHDSEVGSESEGGGDMEILLPLNPSVTLDDEDACSTISQSDTVSGGGTPAHDNETANDGRRMHLVLVGHSGAILDLVTVGRQAVAASEDGFVYCYSLKTGRLKRAVACGTQAVTCLCAVDTEEGQLIFAGSLDGCLRCFTFKSGTHVFDAIPVGVPIQCIDHNWGNIYMGNRDGTVAVFNIQARQLEDPRLQCAEEPILSLKTTKEGPRQVIIVGCRNQPLSIRDAKTGLLMRTLDLQTNGAIYCMLLEASSIYCGTNTGKISVYEFTSGAEICRFTAGVGVVVCLRIYRNLLFAGCYDGFIYVFNLLDKTPLTRIPGPGKMIFCLEIVKNRVIAASKLNNRLEAWSFPSEIRKFFREMKHR